MSSQRETLLAAVATLLTGHTSAGNNVFRSRVTALARGELPAIVIKPKQEAVESIARGTAQRNLTVEIEIHVRGDVPDSQADATVVAAHAALMADQTLGGKVARVIEKETQWDFADADQAAAMVVLTYDLVYLTPTGDLTRTR